MLRPGDVAVYDPVRFKAGRRTLDGHVASKSTAHCLVVVTSGDSYKVPYVLLSKRQGAKRKRVASRIDELKSQFRIGDEVQFQSRSGPLRGTIKRLNPKRARVACGENVTYSVPYASLVIVRQDSRRDRRKLLGRVARQAENLMTRHGLKGWSFQFDDATQRAGLCNHRTKVISMARQYCFEASEADRTDTILHEIAHALVGAKHNHDSVWKAAARAIGCTGDRCHSVDFTPPRYIVSCPRCKWARGKNRRLRGSVCRRCRTLVKYEWYTEARMEELEGKSGKL